MRLRGEVVEHGDAERGIEGPITKGHLRGKGEKWTNLSKPLSIHAITSLSHSVIDSSPPPIHTHTHLQHVAGKHLHSRGLLPPPIPTSFPIPLSLLLLRPPLPLPFLLLLRRPRRARQQADGAVAAEGERGGVEGVPSQLQVLAVPTPDVG